MLEQQNLWDVAFLAAVVVQMVKVVDLLLPAWCKEWVEDKVETFALYLSDLEPSSWHDKIFTKTTYEAIQIVSAIIIILAFTASSVNQYLKEGGGFESISWKVFTLAVFVVGFNSKIGQRINLWIVGRGGVVGPFTRILIFNVFALSVILGTASLVDADHIRRFLLEDIPGTVADFIDSFEAPYSAILALLIGIATFVLGIGSMYLFAAAMGFIYITFIELLLLILAYVAVFGSVAVVSVSRNLVWSIIQYNNGIWAGLSLLITVALGFVSMMG